MGSKERDWRGAGDVTMPATGQDEGQAPSMGSPPNRDWNGCCDSDLTMPTIPNRPDGMGGK